MADTPLTQDSLLESLQSDHARFTRVVTQLSETDQQKPFTKEGWSVKDFLAHTAHWKKASHELLVAYVHDQPFPPAEPMGDKANAVTRQTYAPLPLEQIQANWEEIHTRLEHILVDELDDKRLAEEVRAPWDEVKTLPACTIIAEMCEHDGEHFALIEEHFQITD